MEIAPLGDAALIVRVGDSLGKVLGMARKLSAADLPGVAEVVPGLASVAVFFRQPFDFSTSEVMVREALARRKLNGSSAEKTPPRLVEIPVCYHEEFALDLEAVARHCHLTPADVVGKHSAARYEVRCLGFTPGFPYLAGLPPSLATPRRTSPRISVPAGSVAIGWNQAGIYPRASPGGWNIIGRTPLALFDLDREPAALLQPGDRVRFIPIDRAEFER